MRGLGSVARLTWLLQLCLVCTALMWTVAAHAERPSPDAAKSFLNELVSAAAAAMRDSGGDLAAREAAYRSLLADGFHMSFIARVSLGKQWRKISKAERETYVALFSEFILRSYAPALGGFDPSHFNVQEAVERGKQDMLVKTSIAQPSGPPISAGWRVRNVEGKLQIVDIIIEGVSMALNQRREFQGVVAKLGMSGLMEMLRARTERLSVEPPA